MYLVKGHPEICQFYPPLPNENYAKRANASMDDPMPVEIGHSLQHSHCYFPPLTLLQSPFQFLP